MRIVSLQLHGESTVERTVVIARPVQVVYDFYRDFRNLPRFLGDAVNIELTGPATSRWTIQGPFRLLTHWTARIVEEHPNEFIHYETANSRGWRTSWKVYFSPGSEVWQTKVREVLEMPQGNLGRRVLAFLGKFPAEEVSANLNRLKQHMETGRVTDTSYSVSGKFNVTRSDADSRRIVCKP